MSLASVVAVSVAALVAVGCSHTYHPEYHPETRYSFVQNISYGDPDDAERCKLGRTAQCWRRCFEKSEGEACYLLGVMFETGHGVPKSHVDAARMSALAGKLGYAPASIDVEMAAPYLDLWGHDGPGKPTRQERPETGARGGNVSSPGGVVVYGSVSGDVYLGR